MDITARLVAVLRDRESHLPDGESLFSDPYANAFINKEALEFTRKMEESLPSLQMFVRLRTVFIDQCIRDNWQTSSQLVTLGAGADMRPYRMGLEGGSFFEVDRKGGAAEKEAVVGGKLGLDVSRVNKSAANLEKDSIADYLAEPPFSTESPTIFVLEGLVSYLTHEAHKRIVSGIAKYMCAPFLIIDYYNTRAFAAGSTAEQELSDYLAFHRGSGYLINHGIDDMNAFAEESGVNLESDVSVADLHERYNPDTAASLGVLEHFRFGLLRNRS